MQAHQNTQHQYHILITDPDAEFAGLVAQAIDDAAQAYKVTVNSSVQDTLTYVREAQVTQRPFDLLITDVTTPGSGSMRLIEELTQSYPELKIIAMTAYHSPELMTDVQQLNAHSYLVKPLAPSEIRQIVHDALAGQDSGPALPPPLPPLSNTQRAAVEQTLADLCRATGSTAALLVHTSGEIQAMDCLDPDLDTSVLGIAIMDAQRAVSQALTQTLNTRTPIRQSYFGTDTHNICVHRLDDAHAVATIFDPEVREGQMWYAIREEIETLQNALAAKKPDTPAPREQTRNDEFDMFERYFSQPATPRTRPKRGTRRRTIRSPRQSTPETPSQARAVEETSLPQQSPASTLATEQSPDTPDLDQVRLALPPHLEMERLEIDELNWDLDDSQDWDTLVADTDQAFQGMTFEEAKERGLLDDLEAGS